MRMLHRTCGALLLVSLVLRTTVSAAPPVADPLSRDASTVGNVGRSVLLGAALAGRRLIAVGERGIVALSDDDGRTWRQAKQVPVSVTLTAVRFVDDRTGWAVGHAGVVLHTEDGGETWRRQLDGVMLAQMALQDAQAKVKALGADNAEALREIRAAQLLVDDGADKPFLDLEFSDSKHGVVVGAYNLIYATSDGGNTWQSWSGRTDNPKALHLYAVRRKGDAIFIVGEQGLLRRSLDAGETFARVVSPYEGSWFTLALQPDGASVIAGLRGNAYRSNDGAKTWTRLTGTPPISFVSAADLDGQRVVLANQGGQLFVAVDGESGLRPLSAPPLPALTGLTPLADGGLLALTVQGAVRLPSPTLASTQAPATMRSSK